MKSIDFNRSAVGIVRSMIKLPKSECTLNRTNVIYACVRNAIVRVSNHDLHSIFRFDFSELIKFDVLRQQNLLNASFEP